MAADVPPGVPSNGIGRRRNAAEHLFWPFFQPTPVPVTTIQLSDFRFNSVLQVLQVADKLDRPEPPTPGSLRLWFVLGSLLPHYWMRWHARGGIEELEHYATSAINVLEHHHIRGPRAWPRVWWP